MGNMIKIEAIKKYQHQGISEHRDSDERHDGYLIVETSKDSQTRYRFLAFYICLAMLSLMAFTAKPDAKVLEVNIAADSKPEGLTGIQAAFLSLVLRP